MSKSAPNDVWHRDPARIDWVLATLREAWVKEPQLRLGQLIVNALSLAETPDLGTVYCTEDDILVRHLKLMSSATSEMHKRDK